MFVTSLLLSAVVLGQDEPTPEARAAAREAYGRGQQLYRDGSYEESVAAFEEAYELIPNPIVLLGLAESQERAGDITGTVATFERYLEQRTDAPDRAEIEARVARLRETPAVLVIASVPEGAAITLDGEATGESTPAELEVAPGTHTISLAAEGFESSEEEVEATFAARQEVSVELSAVVVEEDPIEGEGDPIDEASDGDADEEDEDDAGPSTAVWVTTGLAAASLVGGTVLGFMSLSREAEFDDDPDEETADEGERFALFADVLFGVAAVSAITAIVLFLTDKNADEEEEDEDAVSLQVAPVITPQSGGVTAQLRF
ncbi:MAG: PEGA domain-containing protein [Myxococcota bacterium]